MIYWFTGQPGHGKTLHAIDRLLDFKAKGRPVYACNIREFDYEKAGVLEMTPEQFRDWPNFLPDGAVALVDEAYEHDMLPKRAPGSKVPHHVEQLAKHRHRGLDFIFVSQSPDKQCDQFVHDLIERHVHVRRRFGTQFVHLREFDRFEARAEKAIPLINRRGKLPTRPRGLYKSTELDTTERRIPWYYIAFVVGIPLGLGMFYYAFGNMSGRLAGDRAQDATAADSVAREANGALATVAAAGFSASSVDEYMASMTPRIPSQPWTAPAYDGKISLSQDPPRIFCSLAAPGESVDGVWKQNSQCSCVTEQGTLYRLDMATCASVARNGQYEPYYDERLDARRVDGYTQQDLHRAESHRIRTSMGIGEAGAIPRYGQFRDEPLGPEKYEVTAW